MEEKKYTKLSELVNSTFTIEKVWGYKYKQWDNVNRKMLVSEKYEQGYRKLYDVDTNKGKMDLGTGQLGSLLEAVFKDGVANLNGKTFEVKSNGKSGMDIRYYFNEIKVGNAPQEVPKPEDNLPTDAEVMARIMAESGEIEHDLSSIPF